MLKGHETVLVTGAAGGIGSAIAREFAKRGHGLILHDRNAEPLKALADELGADQTIADLADRDDLGRLIDEARHADIAILCAALPSSGSLLEYDEAQLDRALDVNLRAQLVMAQQLSQQMADRGHGHIVFLSSMSGKIASPGTTVYSATKFGVRGAALGLRYDLDGTGVGVSTVCPAFVGEAGMFADTGAKAPKGMRAVTPNEVALITIDAIAKDKAVVDAAPLTLRLAGAIGQVFPRAIERFQYRTGAPRMGAFMAKRQAHLR